MPCFQNQSQNGRWLAPQRVSAAFAPQKCAFWQKEALCWVVWCKRLTRAVDGVENRAPHRIARKIYCTHRISVGHAFLWPAVHFGCNQQGEGNLRRACCVAARQIQVRLKILVGFRKKKSASLYFSLTRKRNIFSIISTWYSYSECTRFNLQKRLCTEDQRRFDLGPRLRHSSIPHWWTTGRFWTVLRRKLSYQVGHFGIYRMTKMFKQFH